MSNKGCAVVLILLLVGMVGCLLLPNLPHHHTDPIETAVANLDAKSSSARLKAVEELGRWHYPRMDEEGVIAPALINSLQNDPDAEIRAKAALAFVVHRNHPAVLPALKAGIEDQHPVVQMASAMALITVAKNSEPWFDTLLDCIANDPTYIERVSHFEWPVEPYFNRVQWDKLTAVLLGHLEGMTPDERYRLIGFMHRLGIYDEAYVSDLVACLDPTDRKKCLAAARMLADMGELGAVAIPEMLDLWEFDGESATNIKLVTEKYIVKFGPLLAPYLDELIEMVQSGGYKGSAAVNMIQAIGPEAHPAIPALVARFNSIDYRKVSSAGFGGIHPEILTAFGSIGPESAESGVPLCFEFYEYLCSIGHETRGAPIRALGMMGDSSPEVMDVIIAALYETDYSARGCAIVAAMRLSPDDPRFHEKLRSMWPEDPNAYTFHDLAFGLSYGENLDLVLPFLEQCFAYPHSQLHATRVVEISRNLGPLAKGAVPEIVTRLGGELGNEESPQKHSSFGSGYKRICLESLAAIGPAAAEALPTVEFIREYAPPNEVAFIDSVITSITPL